MTQVLIILLFLVVCCVLVSPISDLDRGLCGFIAATMVYQQTGGGNSWTCNKNGTLAGNPCKWGATSCVGTALVSLDMSNLNVGGTIPTSIGYLSTLTILVLTGNSVGGTIPSQIGRLSNLILLYLTSNNLVGRVVQLECFMFISAILS